MKRRTVRADTVNPAANRILGKLAEHTGNNFTVAATA